jgi:predicted ATP-grasp superfamily ATP-dependent carboligase
MTDLQFDVPPAVVVGVCGHGLALARALHAAGVPVVALEANPALPGVRTRLARVVMVPSIHGEDLIGALQALAARIVAPRQPVLFLTNDSMVRTLGQRWPQLEGLYALSWADARERLVPLLDKPALEARCAASGVNYPQTFVLGSADDVEAAAARIGFPMIAKPARPLSSFKTALPGNATALRELAQRHAKDLPFLVQRFIPGDDTRIHFSALYLDAGRPLARFDGHKLRSRPMGHTSIAEPLVDDAVHAQTLRFFEGLGLSGPVSLELKRDTDGSLWVIEPTIGRTDFWVGLCIANGVNLPLVEYLHQSGQAVPPQPQRNERLWFNEDRDPFGRWWVNARPRRAMQGRSSSFTYLHRADPGPARAFLRKTLGQFARSAVRRLQRLAGGGTGAASDEGHPASPQAANAVFQQWRQLPAWAAQDAQAAHPFMTPGWFELLQRHCPQPGSRLWLAQSGASGACTHLPLLERQRGHFESLSNYYAALYSPPTAGGATPPEQAAGLAAWLKQRPVASLQLHPLDPQAPIWPALMTALRERGFWVDQYFTFGNWYHPCAGQSWAEYLATRPSRLRNTIVRTQRRLLRRVDCRLEILTPDTAPERLDAAVIDFGRVYARSWKKPEPYLTFVPALAAHAHREGWLRLGLLYLGDEPVAAQLWLVHDGTASIYKLAYDERWARLGVGTLLSAALTEHVLDVDRVHEIDFLAGDDAYKAEWMSQRRDRTGLIAFHRGHSAGWLKAIGHFGARLLTRGAVRRRWEGRQQFGSEPRRTH